MRTAAKATKRNILLMLAYRCSFSVFGFFLFFSFCKYYLFIANFKMYMYVGGKIQKKMFIFERIKKKVLKYNLKYKKKLCETKNNIN